MMTTLLQTETTEPLSDDAIDLAIQEIRNLPFQGVGIISGNFKYDSHFSKLLRLDIAPKSKLSMGFSMVQNKIFICAEEIYLQCPSSINDASIIGYHLLDSLAPGFRPKAASGANGRPKRGEPGGNGANGTTGDNGKFHDAPTIFLVFKKLTIQNAVPGVSTLLKIDVNGISGSDGGVGGEGGDAGNGGQGTDARNGSTLHVETHCAAGPGEGGNAGIPGAGGRGGNAARGGNGGHVIIVCPASEAAKIAFAASFQPGQPGNPGLPGHCGKRGEGGSGGDLSSFCRVGRSRGHDSPNANPENLGLGDPAVAGHLGTYQVSHRDLSGVFSFGTAS